jgi:hypothetical protein
MQETGKAKQFFKATITYKSGREETFSGGLLKGEMIPKKFQKKITDLRNFPTAVKIDIEKR